MFNEPFIYYLLGSLNYTFWLNAYQASDGFYFNWGDQISSFDSMTLSGSYTPDMNRSYCGIWARKYTGTESYLLEWNVDSTSSCDYYNPYGPYGGNGTTGTNMQLNNFCMKKLTSCESKKRKKRSVSIPDDITALDYLFNPALILESKNMISQAKGASLSNFKSLNLTKSYDSLFEILWYTQLPCFDVMNVTSAYLHEHGMLKSCVWKGVPMPCSQIFKTSPTDKGMCCTFNLEAAETMFKEGRFSRNINRMQKRDRNMTFDKNLIKMPDFWVKSKEPKPQAGRSKGLTLILDAHSDAVASSSINDDVDGFYAIVDSKDQFPMTFRKSTLIRPGHSNIVALKATQVTADPDVRSAATPEKRFCLFGDEMELDLHKSYSQANCFLECSMKLAMRALSPNMSDPCIPWYFPNQNSSIRMCDPYEAFTFVNHMKDVSDDECSHCLPDCSGTSFESSVSAAPFRRCDYKNLGMGELCKFDLTKAFLDPPIWGEAVQQQFRRNGGGLPDYLTNVFSSNMRSLVTDTDSEVFSTMREQRPMYDAYDKDIAMVTFFFESTTAYEYVRESRMTYVDFVSQIGGVLGLCMGFSFISFVEIFYWFTFKLFQNLRR